MPSDTWFQLTTCLPNSFPLISTQNAILVLLTSNTTSYISCQYGSRSELRAFLWKRSSVILSSGTLIVLFVLIESEDKLPSVNDHWAGAIVSAESGQGDLTVCRRTWGISGSALLQTGDYEELITVWIRATLLVARQRDLSWLLEIVSLTLPLAPELE